MEDKNKFNLAYAIPQIFYDIIARLIPGFAFFLILKIVFIDTYFRLPNVINLHSPFMLVIGYLIFFYLTGWFLRCLIDLFKGRWLGCVSKTKKFKAWLTEKLDEKKMKISHTQMLQKIRLRNESAGFRIVKLRAKLTKSDSKMITIVIRIKPTLFLYSLIANFL